MVTRGIVVVTVLIACVWATVLAPKGGFGTGRFGKGVDTVGIGCVAEAFLDSGDGVEVPWVGETGGLMIGIRGELDSL